MQLECHGPVLVFRLTVKTVNINNIKTLNRKHDSERLTGQKHVRWEEMIPFLNRDTIFP